MKKLILTSVLALVIGAAFGQKKVETIEFYANGICGDCAERIEYALDVKGVKYASFDVEKQQVKVVYKTKQISEDEIHAIVSNKGYDTSKSKADHDARKALPLCCKEAGNCEEDLPDSKEPEDNK